MHGYAYGARTAVNAAIHGMWRHEERDEQDKLFFCYGVSSVAMHHLKAEQQP